MKELLNRIMHRLRTELPAQRLAVVVLAAFILLICSGIGEIEAEYGASAPRPTPTSIPGDYIGSADSSLRFTRETLTLPGDEVRLRDAVRAGGGVYMFGYDAANRPCLFYMDADTLGISPVSVSVTGTVVGIGAGTDGSLATLSATSRGRYYITVLTPDGVSTEKRLYKNSNVNTPIDSALIYGGGFLAVAGDEVLAFDSGGNCVMTYGPYSGSLQLLFDGGGNAVIVSRNYGEARTTVEVIGSDFSVAASYVLTAGYAEFYAGDGGGLFAATARTLLRVDYADGSGTDYADILLSGGGSTGFIYLTDNCFFSRDDGVPSIWRRNADSLSR